MLYTSPIVYKKLVFSPNFSTTLRHPRSGPEKYWVRGPNLSLYLVPPDQIPWGTIWKLLHNLCSKHSSKLLATNQQFYMSNNCKCPKKNQLVQSYYKATGPWVPTSLKAQLNQQFIPRYNVCHTPPLVLW